VVLAARDLRMAKVAREAKAVLMARAVRVAREMPSRSTMRVI
jgi:ribosomal protein S4E